MTVAETSGEARDKGAIPLDRPDPKPVGGLDPVTGWIAAGWLDLNAHQYAVWSEQGGWIAQRMPYDPHVYLTSWVGFVHPSNPDGRCHLKAIGTTWTEQSPDGKPHFVIIDLGPLPGKA